MRLWYKLESGSRMSNKKPTLPFDSTLKHIQYRENLREEKKTHSTRTHPQTLYLLTMSFFKVEKQMWPLEKALTLTITIKH